MKNQLLAILEKQNMTSEELRLAIGCRHEALYVNLVQLEAAGLVSVWAKNKPAETLWCIAEAA